MAAYLTLSTASPSIPLNGYQEQARHHPIKASQQSMSSSWSLSLLISATQRICDEYNLPPVSFDTPQILTMEKKTMSSPSLRLTRTNTRRLDQFAASTGKDASAIANEAIAFWHEFYATTALEVLEESEKLPPEAAGRRMVKRKA
jgi:hypothetical protein